MRHKTTDEAIHSGWINITDVSAIRKYLTSMARPYHCQPIFNGDRFAIIFADHRMYTPDSVRVGTANMSQIQWNKLNDLNDRVSASTGADRIVLEGRTFHHEFGHGRYFHRILAIRGDNVVFQSLFDDVQVSKMSSNRRVSSAGSRNAPTRLLAHQCKN